MFIPPEFFSPQLECHRTDHRPPSGSLPVRTWKSVEIFLCTNATNRSADHCSYESFQLFGFMLTEEEEDDEGHLCPHQETELEPQRK